MGTATELDTDCLEELDFPVPCGHSQHQEGGPHHRGDAEYIAVAYHDCDDPDGEGRSVYPACAAWAHHVLNCTQAGSQIRCSRCGTTGYWYDMVQIIASLT